MEITKLFTPLQVKKLSAINSYTLVKLETINNTKSAEVVTPMEEIPSEEKDKIQSQDSALTDYNSDSSLTNYQLKVLENFDLLGLTSQQQLVGRGMILNEADKFTADDGEIGDADTHKMKIQLKDQVPLQNELCRIPKPLYK